MTLLSKSKLFAGRRCPLRLWYASHAPELRAELSPLQKALFHMGHRIEALARERYCGGVLIAEDHVDHGEAILATREALKRSDAKAVFEATFAFDGVQIRSDILERTDEGVWNLIEVKSGISAKKEYVDDVALQYYILRGAGVVTGQTGLLLLNPDYLYEGGNLDLSSLFNFIDLTREAVEKQDQIASAVGDVRTMLARGVPPVEEPSRHCRRPYVCEFFDHCRKQLPDHWVAELAGIGQDRLDELFRRGIADIRQVPDSFDLSALQSRIRECVVHDTEYTDPNLGKILRQYEYPIHFLDFEAVAPAIPRYVGTRPYQTLPFQWSNHILCKDGTLRHEAYLCTEDVDPRAGVARTLLESLGEKGTICIYTDFETRVIAALADHLPHHRRRLEALLRRCRDLCEDIRRYYYHPQFHGSFSIKSILPVLVPSMDYTHLSIQEGGQAAFEYLGVVDPHTSPEEKERVCKNLLEYCRQDTLAMVKMWEALLQRTG